ncbi:MAG: hypothetical protein WBX25_18385 [Rhodomicrobium sp.]
MSAITNSRRDNHGGRIESNAAAQAVREAAGVVPATPPGLGCTRGLAEAAAKACQRAGGGPHLSSGLPAGISPPVGAAYGLSAVLHDLLEEPEGIYFEGGDHSSVVRLNGRADQRLVSGVPHVQISRRNH